MYGTHTNMENQMTILFFFAHFGQIYFGSSIKSKLEEGFVFGVAHNFEVDIAKVAVPSNSCTNHKVLNDGNAHQIFDLLSASPVERTQLSPIILRPKSYVGPDGVEIDFLEDGST
jgi:hypothetical protein